MKKAIMMCCLAMAGACWAGYSTNNLGSIRSSGFVVTDIPNWAKAESAPEGMTQNAVIISNELAYTKGGTNVTAAMVGARANDWIPSAADVGALPVTGGVVSNDVELYNETMEVSPSIKFSVLYNGVKMTKSIYADDVGLWIDGIYSMSMIDQNWNRFTRDNGNYSLQGDLDSMNIAISSKMDTTERPLILAEAMSATKSYLTQTNITELTPYGADSIVGKIHSAPSPAGAAVAKSTIEYNASGTACIVTIAAGGQLAATTTGWPNGQATTAIITIGAGATIADNISLVGYGSWPVGEAFIASCVYYNSKVRVVPIQKVQ